MINYIVARLQMVQAYTVVVGSPHMQYKSLLGVPDLSLFVLQMRKVSKPCLFLVFFLFFFKAIVAITKIPQKPEVSFYIIVVFSQKLLPSKQHNEISSLRHLKRSFHCVSRPLDAKV